MVESRRTTDLKNVNFAIHHMSRIRHLQLLNLLTQLLEGQHYMMYFFVVAVLSFVNCNNAQTEPVKMTLLGINHFQSETDSEYQCYLSDTDSDRSDITTESMRTGWTRDTADENREPPDPVWHGKKYQHYKIAMTNNNDNDAFGVFGCKATKQGKLDTSISTTRMRSDADIVPRNNLFTKTVSIGDTGITIGMDSPTNRNINYFKWRHNNDLIEQSTSTLEIDRPIQLDDAGIYECYFEGERSEAKHGLNLLLVRACPSYIWGPPGCNSVCDSCYNGGVCDENNGKCVCAPGFKGENCLTACGSNQFGYNCDKRCSKNNGVNKCSSYLFCLPHPFGCRCNTGFMALDCKAACSIGKFGASCLQPCHCTSGECDRFTGSCTAGGTCEDGWTGDSCQECEGNFFGPQCSQECHCSKDKCNAESGLCKSGGCLPQWVDLYPPYSCQTGLTHIAYVKKNHGVAVPVTCTAVQGKGGNIDQFELNLSREEDGLNDENITAEETSHDETTKMQTFFVHLVSKGDMFYCQLRQNSKRSAVLGPLDVDFFDLPELSSPPVTESVNGTAITISWSAWNATTDVGDPPLVGYIPYYKKAEEDDWTASNMTSPDRLMFTANRLDPETRYSFSVSAVRDGEEGEGSKSEELYVSTICDVPPSPQNVHTEIFGEKQELVKVFWEIPSEIITCSSGIIKFSIYYNSYGTTLTAVDVNNTTTTSWVLSDLTVGTSYILFVTLSTTGGESDQSNSAEHVVPVLPTLSNPPLLTKVTCNSVTLVWDTWTKGKDEGTPPIVSYIPYYRVNSSFDWISDDIVAHNAMDNEHQFTFYNLTEDSSYEFCVVPVRDGYGGEGYKNNILPGNTTACPVDPVKPVGMIVGASIGGFCFILLTVVLVAFWISKRQSKIPPPLMNGKSGTINPAYIADPGSSSNDDYDEVVYTNLEKPRSIPLAKLESYIRDCENSQSETLKQQFSLLNNQKQFNSNVGERKDNHPKNRFKNMIAYDHSRVVLETIDDDPFSDYYNANYIKDTEGTVAFIASQGPNKASVNDFWRMVVMKNIRNIVMLTNVVEGGKDRCIRYWPSSVGETVWFGHISVTWEKEEQFGDYDMRELHLQEGKESYQVTNWHFTTWPDKDVPHHTLPLIEFCNKVKTFQDNENSPLLVHCSAGVGRTGTFIALCSLTDVVKKGSSVDVYGFVEQMRQDRINMVQKASQYKFLHECLLEVFLTGDTTIPGSMMSDLHVSANKLKKQFKLLSKLNQRGPKVHVPNQEESEKMRYPDIAPVDNKRPFLRSPGKTSSTNFINACLVTSYTKRDAYIATQSPLPNTIEDFWRLIYDLRCTLIIMLNSLDEKDKTCCKYWPESDSSKFGHMSVKLKDEQPAKYYTHRQFNVCHAYSQQTMLVHHMQLTSWDRNNLKDIVNFINNVKKVQQDYNLEAPTAIHCINGVGRTGVFLAVESEIERLKHEGKFDVFSTVRRLRGSHPCLVYTEEDYRVCHEILKLEIPENEYANI